MLFSLLCLICLIKQTLLDRSNTIIERIFYVVEEIVKIFGGNNKFQ